ncbi:MAG: hypothetical protein ACRBF0_11495 [Calditrichia bacterium]
MKNRRTILLALAAIFITLSFHSLHAGEDRWKIFSDNVVLALKSEKPGLQQSAMQLVIRYDGKLDVREAVFDVMRVFRNHEDTQVRRLALVALTKMNNQWALGFLERQHRFEDNATIREHLQHIDFDALRAPRDKNKLTVEIDEDEFNSIYENVLVYRK